MASLTEKLEDNFSPKAFLIGLAGVAFIYTLLGLYAVYTGPSTIKSLEARLADHTAFIADAPAEPVVQEQTPKPSENKQDNFSPPETSIEQDLLEIAQPKSNALRTAPFPNLTETTEFGDIPKIGSTPNETVFKAYKNPFVVNRNKPALGIGILNFGLSEELSKNILAFMPSEVSIILSPYAKDALEWQKIVREDGHELWLQTNFQTQSFPENDPGAKAFLGNVSFGYNRDRLHWLLSRSTGYAGLAGFTDDAFVNGGAAFKNLVDEFYERGLGFFEINPDSQTYIRQAALDGNFPYALNTKTIKNLEADNPELAEIENLIKQNGAANIVVKPTAKNMTDLKKWIAQLERKNIQIVPLSAIAELTTDLGS